MLGSAFVPPIILPRSDLPHSHNDTAGFGAGTPATGFNVVGLDDGGVIIVDGGVGFLQVRRH